MNCVTYRALNDAKSIVSHEKLKKRQLMTKAAICIPIAARRYACQPGVHDPLSESVSPPRGESSLYFIGASHELSSVR
jgi:hypothetical protein